jgi:ferredoxin
MKYAIDLDRCQDHGQCAFAAPRIFALDENGKLALRKQAQGEYISPDIDDELIDELEEAASICPVQAIEILDE